MTIIIKKLLKPLIIFLFTNFCWLLCIFFKIKISTIAEDRIGALAAACDMYLRKKRIHKSDEKVIIFVDNPCNITLLNLFKKKLMFVDSRLLKRIVNICKKKLSNKKLYIEITENLHSYREYINTKPEIHLCKKQLIEGYNQIRKWGIKKDNWWVCFHGRDQNYLNSKYPERDFSYHNYRDFDPNTMIEGMKEVIRRGGYAIIMGEPNDRKININSEKIIHYNKYFKSDFLDIFLCSEAKFFVGNSSGLKAVSQCFNTPICASNQIGFNVVLQPHNSLLIYKKLFSTKHKRILTFSEMHKKSFFKKKLGFKAYYTKYYVNKNLLPIQNTKQEIKGLVCDMFEIVEKIDKKPSKSQEKFKKKYFKNYLNILCAGNIAPSFLKLNKNLFNDNDISIWR